MRRVRHSGLVGGRRGLPANPARLRRRWHRDHRSRVDAAPKVAPVEVGALKLTTPRLDRAHLAAGKVGVSWKVQDLGPGIKKWTISSLTVGQKHSRWIVRASGAMKTRATIVLPRGHTYELRFAITDADGKASTLSLGKVKVPEARRRHSG